MIRVFEPEITETDISAVVAALQAGEISGSFGRSIPAFEASFADYCGVKHGVAVTSGTTALHLAIAALDLAPGDEVLISASTNVATALAVHHNQGVPVPVDSENVTWNLDLDLVEPLITDRTRAIIPVHLFGHPVDMDRLMETAERHQLVVIEDAAEAHGAECRGRKVGSFGTMSCFSFYANKVITTGEGGMVVTDDGAIAERLRLLRNLAFTEPRFRHEEAGYNFRMTGYQAAMGTEQLKRIDQVIERKRHVAKTYDSLLGDVPYLQLPTEQDWAKNVYWMYGVVLRPSSPIDRATLTARLAERGVETRTFFCPINQQPFLVRQPDFSPPPCPVADELWETGFYLPSSQTLTTKEIETVSQHLHEILSA